MCPSSRFSPSPVRQNKAVCEIAGGASVLVGVADAAARQRERKLHTCTHTQQTGRTGSSPSGEVVFFEFLHRPQAVLFPHRVRSFVLLCFVPLRAIFALGFVLFCFGRVCYFHWFLAVAWQASWCWQRPFLSFSKSTKKRAEAVSVAPAQSARQLDKVRPGKGFRFTILQSPVCHTRKTKLFSKTNNHRLPFFKEECICLHSKTFICVSRCFAWETFKEVGLHSCWDLKPAASLCLGNTPCIAFNFLMLKKSLCSCVWTTLLTSQNGD